MDVPFSITQAETLVQNIVVYNYMPNSQSALLRIMRDDELFTIVNDDMEWMGKCGTNECNSELHPNDDS